MKFYRCDHCGNIVTFVHSAGVAVMCCGQKMTELVPGTTDAAQEKHVPAVCVEGSTVKVQVGSVEHPMLAQHYIQFIAIETICGSQIKYLKPGQAPQAAFALAQGEELVAVYEYCNLHGLWKSSSDLRDGLPSAPLSCKAGQTAPSCDGDRRAHAPHAAPIGGDTADLTCYNSYYEVDLSAVKENFDKISRFVSPAQIIPVLKADAYGMGTLELARAFTQRCGCKILACSQVYEGLVMREGGLTDVEIQIMGPVSRQNLPHAVAGDMQVTVFTPERVFHLSQEAKRQGKVVKAQVKIETGLNRIGAWPGAQLQAVIDALRQCPNVQLVGAFTHFAQAETPNDAFTFEQFAKFKEGIAQLKAAGFQLEYIHCCNTGAAEWYREAIEFSTHIRVGSLALGYSDIADGSDPIGLRDMLAWRTNISFIKRVMPGQSVGYDRLFRPETPTDVAVVPVGFADGIFCPMARAHGPVLVNDDRAHYVDTCMDQCFIDVTGLDCKEGDPVTIWGWSPSKKAFLAPQELSKYGQVYTSYTSRCPHRIGRVYIE